MTSDPPPPGDSPGVRRRLAAIFAADVAGFSRLVAQDEEATLKRLADYRVTMDAIIERRGGRIANTAGDSVLAAFDSSVEAVRAAVEVQEAMRFKNADLPEDRALQFRIGINAGDVMEKDGDLLGDGVNVAARLESLAEPGGICMSSQVREQIEGKLTLDMVSMGRQRLKNIAKPVVAFKVAGDTGRSSRLSATSTSISQQRWVIAALAAALLGLWVANMTSEDIATPESGEANDSPVVGETFDQQALDDWARQSVETREILKHATFRGRDYALVHAFGIKWVEAEAEARAMGGHLVTISSQDENDFLVNLIAAEDKVWRQRDEGNAWQRFGPWMGLVQKDRADEPAGGWEWSNGEPVTFVNWFWHQPDNHDGVEHYGRFRQFSDQPAIKWDDARATATATGYVVEFETPGVLK